MKKTIKQKILDHLKAGYALTYGQANTITNSQSGYRRLQEILKENPDKYRFIKIKSDNGGYYNVFAKDGVFNIHRNFKGNYQVSTDRTGPIMKSYESKKEAQAQIKKVIR